MTLEQSDVVIRHKFAEHRAKQHIVDVLGHKA